MSVRAGIAYAVWPLGEGAGLLWQVVDRAEELGVDSLWFIDRLVGPAPIPEPVVMMAAVAARTRRIKFGPSVLALGLRNPVLLARELATLDVLSGGRLLPAVGLGRDDPREAAALGVDPRQKARRTDEAIEVMRLLWTHERVTYHGRHYRLEEVGIWPRPLQQPCPPIWVGGTSDAALRRVARLGDGWLASRITPAEVAAALPRLWQYLEEAERDFERDHVGVIVPVYLHPDRERALAMAGDRLAALRADVPLTEYAAFGPPEDCLALLRRYVEAGATKFVLLLACPPQEALFQLELAAAEVIAPLEGR
ncbi:MAG: LLM class flavin-dependent oxidoreductase [Dehalococcoidia bacterium]|jgi:probable F420-dependent oxidoreductase|nr:LLM class flavin-dependent oxidoreductase [Dehalococcoidia bacterium]MDW8008576.1 LLM class flavin-dependent oxidoreductase [Chloroflexota bacterium]